MCRRSRRRSATSAGSRIGASTSASWDSGRASWRIARESDMSNVPAEHAAVQRPSPRQVILGLFVIWQLGFLVLSNLISLYQDAQGSLSSSEAQANLTGRQINAVVDRVTPGFLSKRGHAWEITDE